MKKRSPTVRPFVGRAPKISVSLLIPAVLNVCRVWKATLGYVSGTKAMLVNLLQRLSAEMQTKTVDIDGICEELLERFASLKTEFYDRCRGDPGGRAAESGVVD